MKRCKGGNVIKHMKLSKNLHIISLSHTGMHMNTQTYTNDMKVLAGLTISYF